MTVDTKIGRVEMTVGDKRVTKELTRPIQAICYYGYEVIRTRSAFSAIKLER